LEVPYALEGNVTYGPESAIHRRFLKRSILFCERYDISRKTGYKWVERYIEDGPGALEDLSRKPRHAPNETDPKIVAEFLELRHKHPSWGGKKILKIVHNHNPHWDLPCRSTVCDIFKRHGMIPIPRWRRRIGHPGPSER